MLEKIAIFKNLSMGGDRSHIQQFLKTLKSLEMHLVTKVPHMNSLL